LFIKAEYKTIVEEVSTLLENVKESVEDNKPEEHVKLKLEGKGSSGRVFKYKRIVKEFQLY